MFQPPLLIKTRHVFQILWMFSHHVAQDMCVYVMVQKKVVKLE